MKIFKKIKLFLLVIFLIVGVFIFERIKADSADNVSGYAWSENIGWISFNNISGGGATDYGVNINPTTGIFSGYAWSENIGWISFNRADTGVPPGPPYNGSETYIAKLDLGTKQVSGWARALSFGGGWDGWIKLRGIAQDGSPYGISWNSGTEEFEGWAWSDMVIGWISFNCLNQGVCGASNYKVVASLNQSPKVELPQIDSQIYCNVFSGKGQVRFQWTYQDDDGDNESRFDFRVNDVNNVNNSNPEVDKSFPGLSFPNGTLNTQSVLVGSEINYNTTYYWWAKVFDTHGSDSGWIAGPSFTTQIHALPTPDFSVPAGNPSANEIIKFVDNSQCYTIGGVAYSCKTAVTNRYEWDFNNDGNVDCDSNSNPACRGDVQTSYPISGTYFVRLKITDSTIPGPDNYCFIITPVGVSLPSPEWKEIQPTF